MIKHTTTSSDPGLLSLDLSEVLSEVTVDDHRFVVTTHTIIDGCCILWVRDARTRQPYQALGRFTCFNKRDVLYFIARYTTSPELRQEIDLRRFERKLDSIPLTFFEGIEQYSKSDRTAAFRSLFDLDEEIAPEALARRRRIMARRFHPDAGGDHHAMSLINEAYEHLTQASRV